MDEMPEDLANELDKDQAVATDVATVEPENTENDNEASAKALTDLSKTLETVGEQLTGAAQKVRSHTVKSWSEFPVASDFTYTHHYSFVDEKNGEVVTYAFMFKGLPQAELKAVEKLVQMPEKQMKPAVDARTNQPILNPDGSFKMVEIEGDERYEQAKEDCRNYRTIALAEVSLGYEVPGKNWKAKYKWFMTEQNLGLWQAVFQIVWGKLMGNGLVNFI